MRPDHPWRRLRQRPDVELRWHRMPGLLGATRGARVIVLHPDQSQVQRRCTLAHELAHIELGHTDGCTRAQEAAARELAARWLICLDDLLDALRWAEDPTEVADCLWVDVDTLEARLGALRRDEAARLVDELARTDRGC